MTIETNVAQLIANQEEIIGIFNENATNWTQKLDCAGGTITGDIVFQNFGVFDLNNKIATFNTTAMNVQATLPNANTVLNLKSNSAGTCILNIGVNNNNDHASEINLGTSTESFLKISRTIAGLSKIEHHGIADLIISTVGASDINFVIQSDDALTISSNGNTIIHGDVTVFQNILSSGSGLIGKADSTTSLIISGGHVINAGNNAYLTLHSGLDDINEGGFDFHANGESLVSTLSISKHHISTFSNNVIAPIISITGAGGQLPKLNFIDTSQSLNNKTWQILSENSNLIIQPLDENANPGVDVVTFVRASGTNTLESVNFGNSNEVSIDVVTPGITMIGHMVVGPRRVGWTNISPITNVSRDLAILTGANSTEAIANTAKILRALIADLIAHGLIGG